MKKALISGARGQDASYLAELLLDNGYQVTAFHRRTSNTDYSNIKHLLDRPGYILETGDITDMSSIARLLDTYKPDEFYNLAANSFVGSSWNDPVAVSNANFIGVINCLEAVRASGTGTKLIHASTSEVVGGSMANGKYNEDTVPYPKSPYGVAKTAAEYMIRVYRESFNIFACYARSSNHESVLGKSPIIIKDKNGLIDIVPIEDIFMKSDKHKYEGILDEYKGILVWDGEKWTKIINGTCYRDVNKKTRIIQTRDRVCETTYEHSVFMEDNSEKLNMEISKGEKLFKTLYPENVDVLKQDVDLCKFIGFVVGDGSVDKRGGVYLSGCNLKLLENMAALLQNAFGFQYTVRSYKNDHEGSFKSKKLIHQLSFLDCAKFGLWLRDSIYTSSDEEKRVPKFILNSNKECKQAFFDGYYLADGRLAGSEKHYYKGFTTSSATLCLGLLHIFKSFSKQYPKCKIDYRNGLKYYYVYFNKDDSHSHHSCKCKNEVIKTIGEIANNDGWFFDIQTESQTFASGPNICKIHNSPRRGPEFVTRKITLAVSKMWADVDANISKIISYNGGQKGGMISAQSAFECAVKNGLIEPIKLGNIYAKRDFSHAKDVVKGMWLMAQQEKPDDYVLASGETHAIEEVLNVAFAEVGVTDWSTLVSLDKNFVRPNDVQYLCGDPSKAKDILGWKPEYNFTSLIKAMMKSDMSKYGI